MMMDAKQEAEPSVVAKDDEEDDQIDEDEDVALDVAEGNGDEDVNDVAEDEEQEDVLQTYETKWYEKTRLFVDHVASVSKQICVRPGSRLSLDEQMKRFKGRSSQTTRMKNKPIKEGFKFFALCDAETGYVYEFIPNGRLEKTSIHDIVLTLVTMIPSSPTHNYVVGMDNYFTWSKVMTTLTEIGVGCVGTSRFERGWPPQEFRSIKDERFNTLYTLKDKGKFLIARWIDNNVVTMVTNVHTSQEEIERTRKRPRPTATNRNHIRTVWGDNHTRDVFIPGIIDDYNHWMLGVDKSDQYIAYYRPNLCGSPLRCVWTPIPAGNRGTLRGKNSVEARESVAPRLIGLDPVR